MEDVIVPKFRFMLVLLLVLPMTQCVGQNGHLIKTPQLKSGSGVLTRSRRHRPETAIPPDIALGNNPNVSETGRWGPWSESSQCSRPCGGGVAHQTRRCLDLRPDGNPACTGPSRKYFSCNIQDCSEGTLDFRAEQCSRFNGVPFDGRYYEWVPYSKALSKCELNCMPKGEHFYYRHARKVIDGTRCDQDVGLDVCVDGVCLPVGCDMMLGSNAKEDQCRECGGDGSSCETRKDVYDNDNLPIGYNDILLIPIGATSISIQEKHATNNYLAVRNLNGQYYLNGNWRIDFPRELHFAGTNWVYERRPHGVTAPESLKAIGPLTEPIYIVLLYQEKNSGIEYEYSVPKGVTPAQTETYSWVYGQYGQCTRSCGGGQQGRAVSCARKISFEVVADYLCDPLLRPTTTKTCNTQSCPPSWFTGNWEECTATCGGGVQFRVVYCQRVSNGNSMTVVPHEECVKAIGSRPGHTKRCNEHIKCPAWHPAPWSPCNRICGLGDQSRVLTCQRRVNGQLELFPDTACSSLDKPLVHQNCTNGPCEGVDWIVSDWTGCDACSILLESRTALCSTQQGKLFPDAICDTRRLPNLRRDCPESPPCEVMWYTTQWSECSTKCGNGVQTRVVFCGTTNEATVRKVNDTLCDPKKRYHDYKNCTGPPCEGLWFTGPFNRCTAPCGGGHRTRKVLCLVEELVVDNKLCDPSNKPLYKENCNPNPCDDDEIISVGGCKDSKHGCCPDGVTAAGPNFEGCPTPAPSTGGCEATEFGCCADGVSPALGPFRKGCTKVTKCEETKFKCCPDNVTPAKGPDNLGCPVPETCAQTTHGCCPDGTQAADGPDFTGCEFIISNLCNDTEFGCCPDNFTVAGGIAFENCPPDGRNVTDEEEDDVGGSGDEPPCVRFDLLGACADDRVTSNVTIDCNDAPFGCCPDGTSAADGLDGSGCEVTDSPMDCNNTIHGCCPDGIFAAVGPDDEGCDEKLSTVPPDTAANATNVTDDDFPSTVANVTLWDLDGNTTDVEEWTPADVNATTVDPDIEEWLNVTDADVANATDIPDVVEWSNVTEVTTVSPLPDIEESQNVTEATTLDPEVEEWLNVTTKTDEEGVSEWVTDAPEPSNVTEVAEEVTEAVPTPADDCSQTTYGCCPDGRSVAQGEDHAGCPPVDHGHCLNSPFGCCPDESTPARGANYGGCGCETYPHHCCPDGITPALGPHYTGCSCETFVHGCCPDGRTPARGANHEGCGCEATEHGCCPDRRTPATGPNYEGCGCQASYYGCCPDNHTPANGPNYEGCGCEASYFGCCPDGRTPAHGTNLEGCVPEKVMNPGEVCSLPKERGSCRNFTVKWFFDMDYGGCSRFWYGGCDGNDNRFESQEECQQVCVAPEGSDACRLPKVIGPCDAVVQLWYYDSSAGHCESFNYGGCLGNNNRFESIEKCEETCRKPDEMDPCLEPKVEGLCRAYFVRWYYDKDEGRCKEFVYGGCKGNNNNFETEQECAQQCASRSEKDVCVLPRETGPCRAFLPRWYHDVSDGLCKQFTYGGCQGNKNRFLTKELCENTCNTTRVGDESCSLPRAQGRCSNYEIFWYFDQADGRCRQFYYGGCEGNANRFNSEQECLQSCPEQSPVAVCSLAQSLGNCFDYENRYFYDGSASQCRDFIYGGCGGNQNNFYTVEECEHRCSKQQVEVPKQDDFVLEYCHLAEDKGPCHDSITKWHYDKSDGVCKQFQYGGCQGNQNRFSSLSECEERCTHSQDVCQLPRIAGPCSGTFRQWAFDSEQGSCQEFTFSGCEGNANRFDSLESCEERCRHLVTTASTERQPDTTPEPEPETSPAPQQPPQYEEICRSAPDPGPCSERELRWYHDASDRSCKTFVYGGCLGNFNRFETVQHCEEICDVQQRPIETTPTTTEETTTAPHAHPQANNWTQTCVLPSDPGPCNNLEPRWYYEPAHTTCIPFAYGGCEGNGNNFLTYETCLTTCATSQPCPDPGDCNALSCPYGPEQGRDWRGCVHCRCAEPCRDYECPEGSRCTVEVHVAEDGATRAQAICRQDIKPGECPPVHTSSGDRCEQECSSDLDCPDVLKCCYNGCGFSCVQVHDANHEVGTETESPGIVPEPDVSPTIVYSTDEEVSSSGDVVTLRCTAHGSPAPQVIWARGRVPIVDDRFKQMPDGSLVIEGVTPADDGVYTCIASNSAGVAEKSTRLVVQASSKDRPPEPSPTPEPRPAEIIEGVRVIVTPLYVPRQLDCNAIGWPKPSVTWWREAKMLPRYSEQYEQFTNFSLLIRSVTVKDLGPYECRAYNQIGQVAIWEVTVYTDTDAPAVLEDPVHLKYFGKTEDLDPKNDRVADRSQPHAHVPSNNVGDQPDGRGNPAGNRGLEDNPGNNPHISNPWNGHPVDVDPTPENDPRTHPPLDWGSVPVSARVVAENTKIDSDSPILLDCISSGSPRVVWYKDDVLVEQDNRTLIFPNGTLLVPRARPDDAGTYKCESSNEHNRAFSSVNITVNGMYVPPECSDNPYFANCKLIVKAKYCTNRYYARFCCRSCTLAGQLTAEEIAAIQDNLV